jgi:hypothetical protein
MRNLSFLLPIEPLLCNIFFDMAPCELLGIPVVPPPQLDITAGARAVLTVLLRDSVSVVCKAWNRLYWKGRDTLSLRCKYPSQEASNDSLRRISSYIEGYVHGFRPLCYPDASLTRKTRSFRLTSLELLCSNVLTKETLLTLVDFTPVLRNLQLVRV